MGVDSDNGGGAGVCKTSAPKPCVKHKTYERYYNMISDLAKKILDQDKRRDIELCRVWAKKYRDWGFNPLPSRSDAKRPFVRFADYWEKDFPENEFSLWEPENIQVMTGVHWNLVVLDVDGYPAQEWLRKHRKPCPATWTVANNKEGYHLWYRLPEGWQGPLSSCQIYQGEEKHCEVARKADRALIIAPPSHHVTRRVRYRFQSDDLSPLYSRPPAVAPDWLLDYQPPKVEVPVQTIARPHFATQRYQGSFRYGWDEVLQAIPDKVRMAEYYGLKVSWRNSTNNPWVPCFRDENDRTPSAAINRETGYFIARGGNEWRGSFFHLLVHLGAFTSVSDAINCIGEELLGVCA